MHKPTDNQTIRACENWAHVAARRWKTADESNPRHNALSGFYCNSIGAMLCTLHLRDCGIMVLFDSQAHNVPGQKLDAS